MLNKIYVLLLQFISFLVRLKTFHHIFVYNYTTHLRRIYHIKYGIHLNPRYRDRICILALSNGLTLSPLFSKLPSVIFLPDKINIFDDMKNFQRLLLNIFRNIWYLIYLFCDSNLEKIDYHCYLYKKKRIKLLFLVTNVRKPSFKNMIIISNELIQH